MERQGEVCNSLGRWMCVCMCVCVGGGGGGGGRRRGEICKETISFVSTYTDRDIK